MRDSEWEGYDVNTARVMHSSIVTMCYSKRLLNPSDKVHFFGNIYGVLFFSAQRSSQGETLQKQQRDLEFSSEKEERLKKEIEVLLVCIYCTNF